MENGLDILVVRGFAVPEGRGKWACCYEIRLTTGRDEPLLYRGELHGRRYACEAAAIAAATFAGEQEARRQMASVWAGLLARHEYCVVVASEPALEHVHEPAAG
ncbi:hypothetical protein [Cupriavidus sp. UME77]|uniref:hypothetical protein n=1 Tax=Cupriavidus sp. UME77 TaxID=1862321 RepID=UPI0016029DA5|nr:hypothetical protein [Cupriavidus sp. UME77]MBB1633515.1 hypothetical protein [Cupriavidus sp. UME77]